MSLSFPFIPRTLVKGKQKVSHCVPQASTPTQTPSPNLNLRTSNTTFTTTLNKAKYCNEDYINLFNLALSDYALWADPDLRRIIDFSSESSFNGQTGDGFFPLSRLIRRSKVLGPLSIENLQIPIAKALRSDATNVLEVRLLVSEPSSSTWSGKYDISQDVGAYEVRRRDRGDTSSRPSQSYSRQDWEERTVYVESIPVQYSTIPSIMRFLNTLLVERSSPIPRSSRVQGIILPPHHQDKHGDAPTCKGFALVVLEDILDVEFLLERWPWERQLNADTNLQNPEVPAQVSEAARFGFRVLSKSRWDELKDEYLSYRERLVTEINVFQDAIERPVPMPPGPSLEVEAIVTDHAAPALAEPPKLDITSPYPFDSLVFVRNIHPETNKTTLRKLFRHAFDSSLASSELNSDGIDYVDYNKGMDSCHLRLATSKHARTLVTYFLSNPTIHSTGLDDTGKSADGTSPPILMEVVTGKREQLYWDKVPEKVRRQVVQKALACEQRMSTLNVENERGDEDGHDGYGDNRKRKKQRR